MMCLTVVYGNGVRSQKAFLPMRNTRDVGLITNLHLHTDLDRKKNANKEVVATMVVVKGLTCSYSFDFWRFSLSHCIKFPVNQNGITKVMRKIINQNPMVRMVKNAKKPRYGSNSIMGKSFYKGTYWMRTEQHSIC